MRLPFVTFIILVPDGRSAVEVANKAIMSLLMLAISAVRPARCMNVRASIHKHTRTLKVVFVRHSIVCNGSQSVSAVIAAGAIWRREAPFEQ